MRHLPRIARRDEQRCHTRPRRQGRREHLEVIRLPVIAVCLLVLVHLSVACTNRRETDGESFVESSPRSVQHQETTPTSGVESTDVPVTQLIASQLAESSNSDDEVSTVLSYAAGGDPLCGGVHSEFGEPVLRHYGSTFREFDDVQAGWPVQMCFADENFTGEVDLQARDPSGSPVGTPILEPGLMQFRPMPGDPLGTYEFQARYGDQRLEFNVNVVAATDPALTPLDWRGRTYSTDEVAELFVVGFEGRDTVPLAVYEDGYELGDNDLIATIDIPVDSFGQGGIRITSDLSGAQTCYNFVADPELADDLAGYEGPEGPGIYEVGSSLVHTICFGNI